MIKLLLLVCFALQLEAQQFGCAAITAPTGVHYLAASQGLGGFLAFPGSGFYEDISVAPADSNSNNYLTQIRYNEGGPLVAGSIVTTLAKVNEDDQWGDHYDGRLYYIVDGRTAPRSGWSYNKVDGTSPSNSDPGPSPFPFPWPRIGNVTGPDPKVSYSTVASDKVLIVIDKGLCLLHEFWYTNYAPARMSIGAHGVWDMTAPTPLQRTYLTKTGASVSGMPIWPALPKDDELAAAAAGKIDAIGHALALTASSGWLNHAFTGMASHHQYGGKYTPNDLPFGAKIRLKAAVDYADTIRSCKLSPTDSNIAKALMKTLATYGGLFYDGGYTAAVEGIVGDRISYSVRTCLNGHFAVTPEQFDIVRINEIYCDPGVSGCPAKPPTGHPPKVDVDKATCTSGKVTIAFHVSGAGSRLAWITPLVGEVVPGNSAYNSSGVYSYEVSFAGRQCGTETYTVSTQNVYGSDSARVKP